MVLTTGCCFTDPLFHTWIVSKFSGTELRAPPAPQKQVCSWWCSEVPSVREKHHSTSRMSRFSVSLGTPHSGSSLTAVVCYVSPPRLHEAPDSCCLSDKSPGNAQPVVLRQPRGDAAQAGVTSAKTRLSIPPLNRVPLAALLLRGSPRQTAPERAGTATPATCFVK